MLRASSLGLSLPLTNIFAVQQCRRLCGAGSRWAPPLGSFRHKSHSANHSQAHQSPVFFKCAGEPDEKLHIPTPESGKVDDATPHFGLFIRETPPHVKSTEEARPMPSAEDQALRLPLVDPEHTSIPTQRDHVRLKKGVHPAHNLRADVAIEVLENQAIDPTYQPTHCAAFTPEIYWEKPGLDPAVELKVWTNLKTLGYSNSTDEAWESYTYLVDAIHQNPLVEEHIFPHIPFSHLHRFCRLLSSNKPKTHRQYMRLRSVMIYTHHYGGFLQKYEFNALIDHAGKGWRKVHPEDFAHAKDVYNDLIQGYLPGMSDHHPRIPLKGSTFEPDAYSLTSLASLAARAGDVASVRGVFKGFEKNDIAPNRVTYLSQISYHVKREGIPRVRDVLRTMRHLDLDIGLDGLNICINGYSSMGRSDISLMIYRLLQHNRRPEPMERGSEEESELDAIIARLGEEYIFVESNLLPDDITYTATIQAMAYHGHFHAAIEVFMDKLSSRPDSQELSDNEIETDSVSAPSVTIYRALFLGFSRYAISPSESSNVPEESGWTLLNLRDIFQYFLKLPPDTNINQSLLYLIMKCFSVCTGGNDTELRRVWLVIHKTFKVQELKPESHSRLARLKRRLFGEGDGKPIDEGEYEGEDENKGRLEEGGEED